MYSSSTNVAAFLAVLLGITDACGVVVTLNPSEDTTIAEKTQDTPLGTDDIIETGTTGPGNDNARSRALLKFNLTASVPSNAIVSSASLALKATKVPLNAAGANYNLHRMLRAWSESAATWTNRLSPPAAWGDDGAATNVDYTSVVSQTIINVFNVGDTYTFVSNSNMVGDVQGWVSTPGNNFGWILICAFEGTSFTKRSFGSRQDTSANRPVLTVNYLLPAVPPVLTPSPLSGNQFSFSFNAESNRAYSVEFLGELPGTNWAALTNIPAQPRTTNVLVNDPLNGSNRFYRVRTP